MTRSIVVGYAATPAGEDALALGARLAEALGKTLDIVLVLPAEGANVGSAWPPGIAEQAEQKLAAALERVPDAVNRRSEVRHAESFAAGLIDAAHEADAAYIVVGAAGHGSRGRHRLGTVANELLHSADVSVALAPEGYRRVDVEGITRVTAAIGLRAGADVLMDESVALATRARAELRLVSLVAVDLPAGIAAIDSAAYHADEVYVHVRSLLPEGIDAEAVVGLGESVEDAVASLSWEPTEIAVVGSSRLARRRRLFLGSTAAKMLHVLPVPMIVVPRTRDTSAGAPATGIRDTRAADRQT